jgi:hypothetical protein
MDCLGFFSTKLSVGPAETVSSRFTLILERLFFMWISAAAALTFLGTLVLTLFQIISLMQLFYVYVAITIFTLLLAGLLYISRQHSE